MEMSWELIEAGCDGLLNDVFRATHSFIAMQKEIPFSERLKNYDLIKMNTDVWASFETG